MKKKVTQETANQLRELLEKVILEREDAAPLPKDHQIEYSSQLGVWKTLEFLVVTLSLRFWTWSVPFIVLGAVFFWRRHSFKKEFNALVERAKEEITLWKKKPLETNRTLVKGLEGFLKTLQTEYQFEQRIR